MIEMLLFAMILSGVTLKAIGNAAVDVSFAVRGKESPRYKQAKARSWTPKRPSGPAFRYFSQLWADSWKQRLEKHNAKIADRGPEAPRGAARIFWSGLGQDGRRAVLRKWDQGWTSLDEKRRARSTRVPDGTTVVPGEVVPEAPVPGEPGPVLVDQPDGRTDLQFGTDPTDPNGTQSCPACGGALVVDGGICGACEYRQQQRAKHWESQSATETSTTDQIQDDIDLHSKPDTVADTLWRMQQHPEFYHQPPTNPQVQTTSQEGTTAMTAAATEVTGLNSILTFAEQSAQQFRANVGVTDGRAASCKQDADAYKQLVTTTEQAVAAAQAGGVSGEAVARMAQSMEKAATAAAAMEQAEAQFAIAQEQANAAAADMEASAAAFRQHLGIQEQYNANHGAGTREFITAGQ